MALPPLLTLLLSIITIPILIGILVVPLGLAISTLLVYLSLHKHLSTVEARWIQIPYWATLGTSLILISGVALVFSTFDFWTLLATTYIAWCFASVVLIAMTPVLIALAKRRGPDTQLLG